MRKTIATLLSASVLACSLSMAGLAAPGETYRFGGADPIQGQDGSAQGQNGWYYMWSPETNKEGNPDVSKIKECVASETGSLMFMYGSGLLVDGNKGWVPDIFAADDYDATAGNNWWMQLPDGTMNPAVAGKAPYASAILGFKAPKAGEYSFKMTAVAGANGEGAENDGLTISVNTAAGKLFSKATSKTEKETIEENVTTMLKVDEMIYFVADPNGNGANDVANFAVEGTKVGNYVDNQTTFKFGGAGVKGQDGSAQGQNGWYYMWSPETDKAGTMDVSKIKECVASETGSLMFMYGFGLLVDGNKGWVPDIFAADDYDATAGNNWWMQLPDGTMNPAVAGKAPYASAVLGFKAPKSGEYSFDMTAIAGANGEGAENDGLTVSVYTAQGKLFSKATSKTAKDTINEKISATLKAGEMIYFIADPNANGANDVANFEVFAEITKVIEETTTTTTTTAGTQATDATTVTTTAGTNNNPATGDAATAGAAVCLIAAAASAALIGAKKMKSK